jgi:hypothetical protein
MTGLLMMKPALDRALVDAFVAGELDPRLHDMAGVLEHVRQDVVAAASDG